MILLASVKHSGTKYCLSVLNRQSASLRIGRDGEVKSPDTDVLWSHFDERAPHILQLSKEIKTVIPLRHPAMIAVSWKKRSNTGWLDEWERMCEIEDAFYFPLETKPFDALEEFTGFELNRHDKRINSIGDYPERNDLKTAGRFLEKDSGDVLAALDTKIGRKFYAGNLRWV